MLYTESLLLIDHNQAKSTEVHIITQNSMGADQNVNVASLDHLNKKILTCFCVLLKEMTKAFTFLVQKLTRLAVLTLIGCLLCQL